MKKIWLIIAVVVLAIFVVGFVKDAVIKFAVERGVESVTGLKLSMKSLHVGIVRNVVMIKGLVLYNPKDFTEKIMVDMPEIYVDYDLPAILSGNTHIRQLRIHLRDFNVVKNKDGKLNLDSLKTVASQKKGAKAASKEAKPMKLQIDSLYLKVDRASYKDFSSGTAPTIKEFNINLEESYSDIRDPNALVSLIVVKALTNTSIANIANFDIQGLKGTISGTLGSAQKIASHTTMVANETVKKTAATVKETTDAVQKTTESLKEVFKSPFGSE